MFDPARLWTGLRPSAARTAEIIPAVVVFPFVALTIVLRESLLPSFAIASGSSRSSTRPGSVVPPPRPLARLAAPIARAAATLAPNRALTSRSLVRRNEDAEHAGQHPQGDRQVGQVLAV